MSTDNQRNLSKLNTNTDPDYHSDQEHTPATHNRGVCSPTKVNNTDPDYHSDQELTPATHNRGVCSPVTTPCYNKGASQKNIPNETDLNIKSDQEHKPTTHNKGICSPVSIVKNNEGTTQILKQKNIKVNIGRRLPKSDTSNTLNNYPKSNKKIQAPPNNKPTDPKYYSDQEHTPEIHNSRDSSSVITPNSEQGNPELPNKHTKGNKLPTMAIPIKMPTMATPTKIAIKNTQYHKGTPQKINETYTDHEHILISAPNYSKGWSQTHSQENIKINIGQKPSVPNADNSNTLTGQPKTKEKTEITVGQKMELEKNPKTLTNSGTRNNPGKNKSSIIPENFTKKEKTINDKQEPKAIKPNSKINLKNNSMSKNKSITEPSPALNEICPTQTAKCQTNKNTPTKKRCEELENKPNNAKPANKTQKDNTPNIKEASKPSNIQKRKTWGKSDPKYNNSQIEKKSKSSTKRLKNKNSPPDDYANKPEPCKSSIHDTIRTNR